MSMEEIAVLTLQVKDLLKRITRVEDRLSLPSSEAAPMADQQQPERKSTNPTFDQAIEQAIAAKKPRLSSEVIASPRPTPRQYVPVVAGEPHSGTGNLLGIVASICFVLAGIFIIKLAIDQGWLTPFRQVSLAALFSLTLIGAGMVLSKRDSEYAGLLPACGIILLYADSFGAFYFYGLTDAFGAAAGACATSALSLWLFTRFRNEFYTVLSAVGCYSLPIILPEIRSDFSLLSVFFLVFTFSSSLISAFIKSRIFPMVSAYLGIGILASCALSSSDPSDWNTAALAQLAQFAFFASGVIYYSVRNRSPMTEDQIWAYFPLLLFFYATEYILITKVAPGLAPWISFGFAGFLFLIYQISKKFLEPSQLKSGSVIIAFCSVVLFHSGYLVLLPNEFKPFLLFAVLFCAPLLLSERAESSLSHIPSGLRIPLLCVILICAIEYGRILTGLIWQGLVCAAGIIWVCRRLKLGDANHLLLVTAHIQSVLALYRLVSDSGSIAVSLAWGIYALAVLGISFSVRDKTIGQSSAIVLGIAAAKVLLYDASSASPGIRIICLIMTGMLLYLGGFLFRRIAAWR